MIIVTHEQQFVNSDRILAYLISDEHIYARTDKDKSTLIFIAEYSTHDRAYEEMLKLSEVVGRKEHEHGVYIMPHEEGGRRQ